MGKLKLKTIVIDDSKLQRKAVVKLIKDHQNLELVADFDNAVKVEKMIRENSIDIIFLDIEMPIINGFEFMDSLVHRPQIILITAKQEYAMQAFDYDVTDYLLKPITITRFNASVKKALLKHSLTEETEEPYIFVSSQLKKVKVYLKDIKWIEGWGDYVKVVTYDTTLLVLSTMKAFMKDLPDDQFLRIHKSYIVNLDKVEKFNGSKVEVCGSQIPLSRHKRTVLEEALYNTSSLN